MARQNRLKPVGKYLDQVKRGRGQAGGEHEVLAAMRAIEASGGAKIKRVRKGKTDGG